MASSGSVALGTSPQGMPKLNASRQKPFRAPTMVPQFPYAKPVYAATLPASQPSIARLRVMPQ